MMLNKGEIRKLIEEEELVREYINLEVQLQNNGFDLTVRTIHNLCDRGIIDFDNSKRIVPKCNDFNLIAFRKYASLYGDITSLDEKTKETCCRLEKGAYIVTFNEIIKMPLNLVGLSIHRSSLMRCGATCLWGVTGEETAKGVWDGGYEGRGQTLLVVHNRNGLLLYENARIAQMLFIRRNEWEGYNGIYNQEHVEKAI